MKPTKYILRMNIEIMDADTMNYNGRLQVSENIEFRADSFLEIAHVLARFHELGQAVKSPE